MFAALYRLLLRVLLPPGFRRDWGGAMEEEARLQVGEARTAAARGRLALRLVVDAWATGVAEWRRALRPRGRGLLETMGGGMGLDVTVALRSLRRSPGFALSVTLTLALGIGAVALVFGLVDAYLLRTMPYPESHRLVLVWGETNWSADMLVRGREELQAVDAVAAAGVERLVLDEGGEPQELITGRVTAGYLDLFGAQPVEGRLFGTDDEAPGAEPVVILSYELWVERFGRDPGVVGRSIALGGAGSARRTVAGVVGPGFETPVGRRARAWIPATLDPGATSYVGSQSMTAVGRLAEGRSLDLLRSEVRGWAEALRADHPGVFTDEEVERAGAVLLRDEMDRPVRTPLALALAAAGLVLLVACANVANLVLARTTARTEELSIRSALGSGRARAARGVWIEAGVLSAVGGVMGAAAAALLAAGLERRTPELVPPGGLAPSLRVVAFAVATTALAALLAGVLPALAAVGRDPARGLSGSRGRSGDRPLARTQMVLASLQLAVALVGITAAGVLGRSLLGQAAVDPGFDPEGALTLRITAPPAAYPNAGDVLAFHLDVREALERAPGVTAAGLVNRLPMDRGVSRLTVFPEGYEVPESGELPEVTHRVATSGYLEAVGARLREGRIPGAREDRASGIVRGVVNRAAAQRFWPGESAVGRRFLGRDGEVWMEVAAVVDDLREEGPPEARPEPAVYVPFRDWPRRTAYAVVRGPGTPDLESMKAAVWSVRAGVPVSDARTLRDVVAAALRPTRLLAVLAGLVGVVTLGLGAVGVYGVASYAANRRRREYGIRAILGAGRARLLRRELQRAAWTVSLGAGLGLVASWGAARALTSTVVGVQAADPRVLAGGVLLLLAVGLGAAWLPAHRAAGADPIEALRAE